MKYQETCSHCHHKATAYTHNINRHMVEAFVRLNERFRLIRRPVNINTDLGLDHNQMCNLPKLQYYGFIRNTKDGWIITPEGDLFLMGQPIQTPVATINNEVIADDHPAWKTHKTSRKWKTITEFVDHKYKKRIEYQAEKTAQSSIEL